MPGGQLSNIQSLINSLQNIVNTLIPVAFAVALLFFFWGLARYILSAGDPEAKETGKNIMIWGIIALFVMASVWGIVRFIGTAIGINPDANKTIVAPGVSPEHP
ncbi:pilin [Candidatus Parcubacteria bacterium]|nr:pilin [Candidatus Parcubacteria bacterium]